MSEPPPAFPLSPPLEVVAGVLADASGKVLVAQRAAQKANAGLWEFPGGKIEKGETHAEALVRELREELGIECQVGEALVTAEHAYPFGVVRLHALRCALAFGTPRALEHAALAWVRPRDLALLQFAPANRAVVALLRKCETR